MMFNGSVRVAGIRLVCLIPVCLVILECGSVAQERVQIWGNNVEQIESNPFADLEYVQSIVDKMVKAGKAVAAFQTTYQFIRGEDVVINAERLDPYFVKSSKDMRVPWIPWCGTVGEEEVLRWKFQRITAINSKDVPVCWTCTLDSGMLIAVTLGVYDVDAGAFLDIQRMYTASGRDMATVYEAPETMEYSPDGGDHVDG